MVRSSVLIEMFAELKLCGVDFPYTATVYMYIFMSINPPLNSAKLIDFIQNAIFCRRVS